SSRIQKPPKLLGQQRQSGQLPGLRDNHACICLFALFQPCGNMASRLMVTATSLNPTMAQDEGVRPMPQQTRYAADAGRIVELQRDIRSGALSSAALVERCLARIDAIDPAVQAWRHVARDSARAEAELLDRDAQAGRFRGPLHGIPV